MTTHDLARLACDAHAIDGIASAAIFVRAGGSEDLALGGAAGIDGLPLANLEAAVRDPAHPVARALQDSSPTYDVAPMTPGGPKLRSHLPLGGLGVLAVSHDEPVSADVRTRLESIAAQAIEAIRSQAS